MYTICVARVTSSHRNDGDVNDNANESADWAPLLTISVAMWVFSRFCRHTHTVSIENTRIDVGISIGIYSLQLLSINEFKRNGKSFDLSLVGRCLFGAPFGLAIKCLEWINFFQLLSSLSAYCFLPCSSFASCFIFFRFGLFTGIRTFSSCCEVPVSASTRWDIELCVYFRSKLC